MKHTTQQGITLIALIITIVVLMILAVVAIQAVTGDGTIGHAKDATTKYAEGAEKENSTLQSYTDMIAARTGENNSEPKKEVEELGEAINAEHYGTEVNYQSQKTGLKWRLYYEDSNFAYLISETTSGDYPVPAFAFYDYDDSTKAYTKKSIVDKYNGGADVSKEGQVLMPKGKAAGLFDDNHSENIVATAYMCDTNENGPWREYLDKDRKALFAIGGPTCDLLEKSFNAYSEKKSLGKVINYTATSTGYDTGGTNSLYFFGTVAGEYANGIYRLGNQIWWLASPYKSDDSSYYGGEGMRAVGDIRGFGSGADIHLHQYARPVVCIPKAELEKLNPELKVQ